MRKKSLSKNLFITIIIGLLLTGSLNAKNKSYCLTEAEKKQISELIQDFDICEERLKKFAEINKNNTDNEIHYVVLSVLSGIILGLVVGDKTNGSLKK